VTSIHVFSLIRMGELPPALAGSFLRPPPGLPPTPALAATRDGRGQMSTGVNSGRPDPTQESVLPQLYKPSGSHPPAGTGGLPADQVKRL